MKKSLPKIAGIIYLIILFTLLLMGSHFKVEYEFISPIAEGNEIENYKMSYKIVEPKELIKLKVSHYWPPLGGTNCGNFVDGECISKMANGERWQEFVGIAIACPQELDFGTRIKVLGREFTCKDRGSRITKEGDTYWIDTLTLESIVGYGDEVTGEIL